MHPTGSKHFPETTDPKENTTPGTSIFIFWHQLGNHWMLNILNERCKWHSWFCLRNKTLCWGLCGLAQGWPKVRGPKAQGLLVTRGQANKAWSKAFCSYSNMVTLSDKCNLKKHYPRMESVWKGFWWGLLVSERAFGETTKPSSLVLNLNYSVWLL